MYKHTTTFVRPTVDIPWHFEHPGFPLATKPLSFFSTAFALSDNKLSYRNVRIADNPEVFNELEANFNDVTDERRNWIKGYCEGMEITISFTLEQI